MGFGKTFPHDLGAVEDAAEAIQEGHSFFVREMQDLGYIPEGVLNWIALMGWGVPEDDVMTLDQMIERFDIDGLTPSPAGINYAKLDHFNGAHIRLLPTDELAARIRPFFLRAGYQVDAPTLLAITPPIVARSAEAGSGPYCNANFAAALFRFERMTPGSTMA